MKNLKIIKVIFILMLFNGCEEYGSGCQRKNIDNDWNKMRLKGKIQQMDVKPFNVKVRFGEIEADGELKYPDTKMQFISTEITNVKFNEFGNKITETILGSGEIKYKYDQSNRLIGSSYQIIQKERNEYIYDKEGKIVEENGYCDQDSCTDDDKATLTSKIKHHYNNEKKLLRSEWYSGTGELTLRIEYEYNNKGLISSTKRDAVFFKSDQNIEYNENNDESKRKIKNNLSGEKEFVYQYLYDEKKNWIKKVIYLNNEPLILLERKIIYFNF